MDDIISIVLSWQVLAMGVIVALLMAFFMWMGSKLWQYKKLRKAIKFCAGMAVWLPAVFGAAIGAIPYWPRPGSLADLEQPQAAFSMVVMGLLAGQFYERIWKFVKEKLAARGLDIELDMTPKEQLKKKNGG